jgi:hypothetical protein
MKDKISNGYSLKEELKNGVVTVTFEKVNGEERTMKATLLSEYLPQEKKTIGETKPRKSNDEVLNVWDVEANDWRSFRIDNVKKFLTESV